jgi:hypothetical protein
VAAEDVGRFQLRLRHDRGSGRWHRFDVQQFERALNLPDRVDRDARIARRRIDVAMTGQVLNDADALLQKMRGETVPQRMQVTDLSSRAASAASRQARCSVRAVIGCEGSGLGKSQWHGLVRLQ